MTEEEDPLPCNVQHFSVDLQCNVALDDLEHCSMSSMQHVARCLEIQRVRYSETLLSRLQHVALKNTQRVA